MINSPTSEPITQLNYQFLVLVREAAMLSKTDPHVTFSHVPTLMVALKEASDSALMLIAQKAADRGLFLFGLRDGEGLLKEIIAAAIQSAPTDIDRVSWF